MICSLVSFSLDPGRLSLQNSRACEWPLTLDPCVLTNTFVLSPWEPCARPRRAVAAEKGREGKKGPRDSVRWPPPPGVRTPAKAAQTIHHAGSTCPAGPEVSTCRARSQAAFLFTPTSGSPAHSHLRFGIDSPFTACPPLACKCRDSHACDSFYSHPDWGSHRARAAPQVSCPRS